MRIGPARLNCLWFCVLLTAGYAVSAAPLVHREWTVDGVVREALVYVPPAAKSAPTPIIFAFHGHGGNMNNAARNFGYEKLWPEAMVVYMQGLNTPGRLTDPQGEKPGWQSRPGDQDDRDVKFFDALLASLNKEFRVDEKRIFATGHSNGGGFSYLLWAMRGEKFAAFAPSGAAAIGMFGVLKPKPVLHVAGEADPLVKFAWQKETMDGLRKLNQCGDGQLWGKWCTIYPSKIGAPVVTFIHRGGHQFPSEAPAAIVRFFHSIEEQPNAQKRN